MTDNSNHYAEAAMLIRKPVAEVFDAIVNPDSITKFWFTHSSGRLVEGQKVEWRWEMYNFSLSVLVKTVIPKEKIIIQWGEDKEALVEWTFQSIEGDKTFLTIKNTGFKGTQEELISKIRDSTGGFTWVLAGLKAYLEHGIQLNLVADRYPQGH